MVGQPSGARHALAQLPPRSLTLGGRAGGQHHAGLSRPPSDAAITVNVPGQGGAENHLVHAVVMEQSSIVQGIAVYGDDMALEIARSGDREQAAGSTGLSVMFGEAFEIPAVDYDWAERNGFDVARGLADAHAAQPREEPPAAAGVGTGLHEAADTAFAEAALERPGTARLAGNRRLKTCGHFQNLRPPVRSGCRFSTCTGNTAGVGFPQVENLRPLSKPAATFKTSGPFQHPRPLWAAAPGGAPSGRSCSCQRMPPWVRHGVMCDGWSRNQIRSHSSVIARRSSDV